MTKSLDNIYADTMFENLSNIYYKYLFTKEHFDVYFFMKDLKINNFLLEILSQKLFNSIPEKNKIILFKKFDKDRILNNIRNSIIEIFEMFSTKFETSDIFEDLPFTLDQFDCELRNNNIFFSFQKYNNHDLYIENYLRVVDKDINDSVQNIVSNRDDSLKNVCKISNFLTYLETDPTLASLDLVPRRIELDLEPREDEDIPENGNFSSGNSERININRLSPFKSIVQGVRIIYLINDPNIINNVNLNVLKQNEMYKKEKCWVLFGRTNAQQEQNSITKFPFEIARSESVNLIDLYGPDIIKKIRNTVSYNELNKKLLGSLITNNSYKNFFEQIVPTKFISIMNYAHFKKMSRMIKETIEKNNVFGEMDKELFKLMNQFLDYKEFAR